jgi:methylated-DNA-[protein]-cysteine S-methyltransferase
VLIRLPWFHPSQRATYGVRVIETPSIMDSQGLTLFATPIGCCGLAWGDGGVVGVQLPQANPARTQARLSGRFPDAAHVAPPAHIAHVVTSIKALLMGEPVDLTFVVLDEDGLAAFDRAAYAIARGTPPGATITYGEIAARIGDAGAACAVGRAMGANPFPIIVPCHRVLGADGRMGGFSASGGVAAKARLLSIERARIDGAPLLFDDLPITVKPPPARFRGRPDQPD